MIIFFIAKNSLSYTKSNKLYYYNFIYSNISLKNKGVGYKNVIENDTDYKFVGMKYLKEILINGMKRNRAKNNYHLNKAENYVELIWDEYINSTEHMFFICRDITEINLYSFSASHFTNMGAIFASCSS